jgi:hypothetical protein
VSQPQTLTPRRSARVALAATLGLCACAAGLALALRSDGQPGAPAQAPRRLPAELCNADGPGRLELLVFAHPQCPCTRATLAELERILAHARVPLRARAWVLADDELGPDWTQAALWRQAAAIPGLELAPDRGGALARALGVHTSGEVLLYSAAGELLFDGGVTPARAHEGDAEGKDALIAFLEGRPSDLHRAPVFGCGLETRTLAAGPPR